MGLPLIYFKVKQVVYNLVLFCCLLGLIHLTCSGIDIYTVQVAASKTPTDVKWFSVKYQIHEEILEINEKGWYKYVIGQFNNNKDASAYISLNLQSNGLQGPFPRLLPDSLKKSSVKIIKPDTTIVTDKNENQSVSASVSVSGGNKISGEIFASKSEIKPVQKTQESKYTRWKKLIGWESLQYFEIKLIMGAKSFLPRSLVPFYVRMINSAIKFPVILFFLMLINLFVMNTVMIMVILEISNNQKNQTDRYNEIFQTMYERVLTGYLFQEFDIETAVLRMKKIHLEQNRKILISVLFNFQKNLSGESDQKILEIFYRLSLHEDALKKIKSHSFYQQIVGLRELTNLYPAGAFSIVESYINDKNDELRAEAQSSYVRLNREEPFRFLKYLKKPFTRWTQLTSFYIFKLHKLPAPYFSEFLQSDLYYVQNFSLRMVTYFQQKENAAGIIKLLDASRKLTRFLAIKAINDLGIIEAKPLLKERFDKETYRNKLEIIKALTHVGDVDDFDFLEYLIRGNDETMKLEACRSMYFMNSSGVENIVRLNEEKELNLQLYIAHIDDHRN